MLFTGLGRSVWEKTVPLVLSTALGLRPRAVLKTSGTVFSYTDPSRRIVWHIRDIYGFMALNLKDRGDKGQDTIKKNGRIGRGPPAFYSVTA